MTEEDRRHWESRYAESGLVRVGDPIAPRVFAPLKDLFPKAGRALEIACGRGESALWLASRVMDVYAVDVSPVAIRLARELVSRSEYAERARFEVFDLDNGMPDCPRVELVLCLNFRDAHLDQPKTDRLGPGGLCTGRRRGHA